MKNIFIAAALLVMAGLVPAKAADTLAPGQEVRGQYGISHYTIVLFRDKGGVLNFRLGRFGALSPEQLSSLNVASMEPVPIKQESVRLDGGIHFVTKANTIFDFTPAAGGGFKGTWNAFGGSNGDATLSAPTPLSFVSP